MFPAAAAAGHLRPCPPAFDGDVGPEFSSHSGYFDLESCGAQNVMSVAPFFNHASSISEACLYREITVFTRILTDGNVTVAFRPPEMHPVRRSQPLLLLRRRHAVRIVLARQRGIYQSAGSASAAGMSLTARQAEVLQLAGRGLSGKQIARHLGISARTVEDHFSAMQRRTRAHSRSELIAYWAAAGLVKPGPAVPETAVCGTAGMPAGSGGEIRPGNQSRNSVPLQRFRDGIRDARLVTSQPAFDNSVRIGYARVSTRAQDHQTQLDALAAAHCREVVVETASTRDARPKLHVTLAALRAGDTLVIYKPDRVARSMKELLVLLEDQLHARGVTCTSWPESAQRKAGLK
jgi:DNA-binding CsgD family transcriptional regulator